MGRYSGKTCRLLFMLALTLSFFLVEIVVGYVTNSIALVADSFHMLSDVVALIVGFCLYTSEYFVNCVSLFLYSVLPECLTLFSHSLCVCLGGRGGCMHARRHVCMHMYTLCTKL